MNQEFITDGKMVLPIEQQAQMVLSIYQDRGEAAISALTDSRWEDLATMLRGRAAAFHNFRVIDGQACLIRKDYLNSAELQMIWQRIQETNKRLGQALSQSQIALNEELALTLLHKQTISKFRSGSHNRVSFRSRV